MKKMMRPAFGRLQCKNWLTVAGDTIKAWLDNELMFDEKLNMK